MTESIVQQLIQLEGPGLKCQLMRNNSGAFKDTEGRFVRFGLGNVSKVHSDRIKSSDLIGFTVVTVTPEMVGQNLAVFTAVEVKDPEWKLNPEDKRTKAQMAFLNWIRFNGGFAGFARSVAEFRKILGA
jgi:hypothetical protein